MMCSQCRQALRTRRATLKRPYHYVESGLENVYLVGIKVLHCEACNEEVAEIPNILNLHGEIGSALIKLPRVLIAEEVRFLRKNLGLKGTEFAEYLSTTPVSVSRWENNEQPVSPKSDRLIRYFYLRYREEIQRKAIRERLISKLKQVESARLQFHLNFSISGRGRISSEIVTASPASPPPVTI